MKCYVVCIVASVEVGRVKYPIFLAPISNVLSCVLVSDWLLASTSDIEIFDHVIQHLGNTEYRLAP